LSDNFKHEIQNVLKNEVQPSGTSDPSKLPILDIEVCSGTDCFHECAGNDVFDGSVNCTTDAYFHAASINKVYLSLIDARVQTLIDDPGKYSYHTFLAELFPNFNEIEFKFAEDCNDVSVDGCHAVGNRNVTLVNAKRKPMVGDLFTESFGVAQTGFERYVGAAASLASADAGATFGNSLLLNENCVANLTAIQCLEDKLQKVVESGKPILMETEFGVHSYGTGSAFSMTKMAAMQQAYYNFYDQGLLDDSFHSFSRLLLQDHIGTDIRPNSCGVTVREMLHPVDGITDVSLCNEAGNPHENYAMVTNVDSLTRLMRLIAHDGRSGDVQLISAHLIRQIWHNAIDEDELGVSITTRLNSGLLAFGGMGGHFGAGLNEMGQGAFDEPTALNFRTPTTNSPVTGGYWVGVYGTFVGFSDEADTTIVYHNSAFFSGMAAYPAFVNRVRRIWIDESARVANARSL